MKAAVRKATTMITLVGVTAFAAASQADQAKPAPTTDEMVVTNTKPVGLAELSKAMKKAQDHFLELYNTVNRNTDQRLSCADRAPTGTRLSQRSCSTRAQNRATEEMARNYMGAVDVVNTNVAQNAAVAAEASTAAQAGAPLSAEQTALDRAVEAREQRHAAAREQLVEAGQQRAEYRQALPVAARAERPQEARGLAGAEADRHRVDGPQQRRRLFGRAALAGEGSVGRHPGRRR